MHMSDPIRRFYKEHIYRCAGVGNNKLTYIIADITGESLIDGAFSNPNNVECVVILCCQGICQNFLSYLSSRSSLISYSGAGGI